MHPWSELMLAATFLVLCAGAGMFAWHRLGRGGTAAWLGALTVSFGVFVLAFHVAGGIELAVGRPIVSVPLVTAAAAGLLLLGAGLIRLLPKSSTDPSFVAVGSVPPWRIVPLVTAVVVIGVFGLLALLLAGSWPQGFEARAYHVPLAVRVLYQGTLRIVDGTWMHAYPVNMSLWVGFWIYLLPERLIALANLPFLALAAVALFAMARGAGADRSAALMVATGLATIPLFSFGALQVSADLGGVAFITIAAWFALARPVGRQASAALAGLAAGLAFGFKSLHLVPLGLLGLWLLAGSTVDGGALRQRLGAAGIYALAALAPMAYWLIRNYLERGNPLYPVFVPGVFDLLGWTAPLDQQLLANTANEREWVSASWRWLLYPWQESHLAGQNFKHSSGLGPFFAATVPVAALVWPFAAWSRRGAESRSRVRTGLFALALGVLAVWWMLGDRQPRYFMAAIPPLLALAAWLHGLALGRLRTVYECLLAGGILLMTLPPLLGQARETIGVLSHDLMPARHKQFEYPSAVDDLPAGALVVNGYDRPLNYPLMGSGLRNRVMDILEARRRFGAQGGGWRFTSAAVRAIGATHFYAKEDVQVETDGCVSLREVDVLRANPFNGRPYAQGRVLYAIEVCISGPQSGGQR